MKIRVKILEGGTEGREINPLGEKPVKPKEKKFFYPQLYGEKLMAWDQAEASLKTFEIGDMVMPFGDGQDYDEFDVRFAIMQLPIGSIHDATLMENGKIKIIS